jgi:hypothetical protein
MTFMNLRDRSFNSGLLRIAIERLIASITMNIGVTPLPLSSRLPQIRT